MFFITYHNDIEWFDTFRAFARRLIWCRGQRWLRFSRISFGFYNRFTGVGNWVAHV